MRASTALALAAAVAAVSAAPTLDQSEGTLAERHVPHEFSGGMHGGPGAMHLHRFGPIEARQGPGFGGYHFGGGEHLGGMGRHRGFGPRELEDEQLEARQGPGFGGHHFGGGHHGGMGMGMHRGFGPRDLEARQGPGFGGRHFGGGHFGGMHHGPRELTDELEARWGPGPMMAQHRRPFAVAREVDDELYARHFPEGHFERHNPGYGGFHRGGNVVRGIDGGLAAYQRPVGTPRLGDSSLLQAHKIHHVIARDVDDELVARWHGGMGGGFGGRFHPQRSLAIDELD